MLIGKTLLMIIVWIPIKVTGLVLMGSFGRFGGSSRVGLSNGSRGRSGGGPRSGFVGLSGSDLATDLVVVQQVDVALV